MPTVLYCTHGHRAGTQQPAPSTAPPPRATSRESSVETRPSRTAVATPALTAIFSVVKVVYLTVHLFRAPKGPARQASGARSCVSSPHDTSHSVHSAPHTRPPRLLPNEMRRMTVRSLGVRDVRGLTTLTCFSGVCTSGAGDAGDAGDAAAPSSPTSRRAFRARRCSSFLSAVGVERTPLVPPSPSSLPTRSSSSTML